MRELNLNPDQVICVRFFEGFRQRTPRNEAAQIFDVVRGVIRQSGADVRMQPVGRIDELMLLGWFGHQFIATFGASADHFTV